MPIVPGNYDGSNPLVDTFDAAMQHFTDSGTPKVPAPLNAVVTFCTELYLDSIDPSDPPAPRVLEQQLLRIVNGVCKAENTKTKTATEKLPTQRVLNYWQVAQILLRIHHVVRIAPSPQDTDREYDLLAMYVPDGRNRGLHTPSEDDIRTTARRYNTQLTLKEFNGVQAVLREDSPRMTLCAYRDLVPVNNGVFNYSRRDLDLTIEGKALHFPAKALSPFDPALVFLSKARVDYVEDAPEVVITHPTDGDWEVGEWIREFYYMLRFYQSDTF